MHLSRIGFDDLATSSDGSAGFNTGAAAPLPFARVIGFACQRCGAANFCRAFSIAAMVTGSVMSQPLELPRTGSKIASGAGIAGFAAGPWLSTAASGSRAISAGLTLLSTI